MLRPVKIILLSVFLVGCYSEPYHRPHVEVINKWSVKDKNVKNIDSKNIPYIAWWRDFKDPTLNQLIERGLISNTSLGMSRGSIEAAEGELKKNSLSVGAYPRSYDWLFKKSGNGFSWRSDCFYS